MWQEISQAIAQATNTDFQIQDTRSVSGGCINQGYQVIGSSQQYFVKLNQAPKIEMFQAEALGLQQMIATKTLVVPQPVCSGIAGNSSYLVLEWLDLGRGSSDGWQEMGKQLALMHKQGTNSQFGWNLNNTIGSTPQINDWSDNWADFFAEQRIGYQLNLAKRKDSGFSNSDQVVRVIRDQLAEHQPVASLVHGDLWSGNADITTEGQPTIFDPASYYGDREVDIAMTELFGGFPASFYQGYDQQWQLDTSYKNRKNIYNLYHILNHFNLFGGGYGHQAQRMIREIL